ncbi:hypothetical protein KTR66_07620 [Roseococcus sp. SDR]|uniref:aminotransferase class V-fold PLP-dependent enzyme n=1 Tax=Roseococcus sp. SDR TaxID=2835532 RepID=UPI001BCF3185|nr:hypothetical protein [Roseococcus sp. SDR]MBS7789857.1 hypothetical protein [Roseococcus sp. SDR]MBV1845171.1 hypothetical protein [Roseococcus sp. SDR]
MARLINARGTFTPLGVSRSSPGVAAAVAAALGDFALMADLQAEAGRRLAQHAGAEAGTVVHCAAAAITLTVAAVMTGGAPERVAALPDARGMPHRVVLPAGHAVDYGHPIEQAVRLAGARPVLAGTPEECGMAALEAALAHPETAALLLVSSRLTSGPPMDIAAAVGLAHARGLPVILDGAAQDWRMVELLGTGADLLIVSAQKYLAAPTAGLVLGRAPLVAAVQAQERGIGRGMKVSKEALAGVIAALAEREALDAQAWRAGQAAKLAAFLERAAALPGVIADAEPDPTGLPFDRARLRLDPSVAPGLAAALRRGDPTIWTMDDRASLGEIRLELVPLREDELDLILARLGALLAPG